MEWIIYRYVAQAIYCCSLFKNNEIISYQKCFVILDNVLNEGKNKVFFSLKINFPFVNLCNI